MLAVLANVYRYFNKRLFRESLPDAEFSDKKSRKGVLEFVPPQLIVAGAGFPDAGREVVVRDLLHCMLHVQNAAEGVVDHAREYHNRHFAAAAAALGFWVASRKGRGWDCLSFHPAARALGGEANANRRLRAAAAECPLSDCGLLVAQEEVRGHFEDSRSPRSHFRYTCRCGPPHNAVFSGRHPSRAHPLDITCNLCGHKFSAAGAGEAG